MHTLNMTNEQLAVIDKALSQMPYGIVAALVADINRQLAESREKNQPSAPENA